MAVGREKADGQHGRETVCGFASPPARPLLCAVLLALLYPLRVYAADTERVRG